MNAVKTSLFVATLHAALALVWLLSSTANSQAYNAMTTLAERSFEPLFLSQLLVITLSAPLLSRDNALQRAVAGSAVMALMPLPLWMLIWLGGGISLDVALISTVGACALSLGLLALGYGARRLQLVDQAALGVVTLQIAGTSLVWLWRGEIAACCL